MNVRVDANVPFLRLAGPARSRSGVVIALTPRYKSLSDDVLRDLMLYFDNPILLGIPEEWRTVSGISGLLTTCEDFLEMAQIIASAALFVGNPGLPYAIAEGLKVLRIVDIPLEPANAFPLGPRGYLIPAERRAFATMLARLCASDGELAACCRLKPLYDDLLKNMQQLQEESRRLCGTGDAATALHAAGPVDLGCLAAGGKAQGINLPGAESLIPQNGGLLLHPNDPGQSRAEAAFADLYLAGHNCFETGLHVDHPLSGPVRFHLRMEYADGAADERFTDVFPTDPVPWRVWFKRTYGPVRVVLGTEMAPGAASRNCAWAVFDRPRLCVL
jgi:hypothetical protein